MDSIKKIYTIGYGPSSSHTMGPRKAAEQYKARHPEAAGFRVTLYGSLAATGKGHFTDKAILSVLEPAPTEILWKPETVLPFHTNGMLYEALDKAGNSIDPWTVYSIGGGALSDWLVRRGWQPRRARLALMLLAACAMPVSIMAVLTPNAWLSIACIALILGSQSCWMANQLTLISESVPRSHVGSLLALSAMGVDDEGLEALDREVLRTIIERFGGGPVGIDTIAASVGEERVTIEDAHEPYLIQAGFLHRSQKGRIASAKAYRHLGIALPENLEREEQLSMDENN